MTTLARPTAFSSDRLQFLTGMVWILILSCALAHSARLASFYCNGRPRARAPIMIAIITANINANTKNSSLYVRYTTCKPNQWKTK